MSRPSNIRPPSPKLKKRIAAVLKPIAALESFIDESEFIPTTGHYRSIVILALLSKSLTVARAVCALVTAGFPEEAFGLTRTLIDVYFIVRYISNKDTEARATRYAEFFMKDHESWVKMIPKFYPSVAIPNNPDHSKYLEIAKKYKNPHEWSGEAQKTRSLAIEPDTFEFDSNGQGITAEFEYEALFKWTSHFVHSTVSALGSHAPERGDVFKIRAGLSSEREGELALLNILGFIPRTFICGFRALRQTQPDKILRRMFVQIKIY